jgi:hypothetical protein
LLSDPVPQEITSSYESLNFAGDGRPGVGDVLPGGGIQKGWVWEVSNKDWVVFLNQKWWMNGDLTMENGG